MDFSGKKVLVYGAGKSGIGAVNLLVKLGAHPVLFDEKPGLTGEQMLAGVDEPGEVTVCAGTLPENIAHALDLIVMSPGVPVDLPRVRAWKEAGLPVIGEVELAYRAGHGRVLAVTGTNGKTTTTSLLGDIMRAAVPFPRSLWSETSATRTREPHSGRQSDRRSSPRSAAFSLRRSIRSVRM